MIYLIGGTPKCGKTTLAKKMSKKLDIPWLSTDSLQNVIKPYINKEDLANKFPSSHTRFESNDEKYSTLSSEEIISNYRTQATTLFPAIDMFCISEITDGNDFIIEGYHIEPKFAKELSEKYPGKIASIFLTKTDIPKFIKNIKNSTTPNDWILKRTNEEETFTKIAEMISEYGSLIKKEAYMYVLKTITMDNDFEEKIEEAIEYLRR